MKRKYDVAAYIWPSYTGKEPRTKIFWPDGEGEWQTVRKAEAKYPGHTWPRKPLLGYLDEAEPETMAQQIDIAANHGVNVFIYDWYWYDRRPFLENCLNDGYLPAAQKDGRVQFYLMWANHNAEYLWDKRISNLIFQEGQSSPVWYGSVDITQFRIIWKRLIEQYFTNPLYYKIDGKPVFAIYDYANFVNGLGGLENTKKALDEMREACVKAGLPGIHLQAILQMSVRRRFDEIRSINGLDNPLINWLLTPESVKYLGFDSVTHYQFVHFVGNVNQEYLKMLPDVKAEYDFIEKEFGITYFPHTSVGWDTNPRFTQFVPGVMKDTTPENIKKGLELAKEYADSHPDQVPLITVNSWNEWTETSYLLPDDLNGYGYLEAIRDTFC